MSTFNSADLLPLLPALLLVAGGSVLALGEVFLAGDKPERGHQAWLAAAFSLASLVAALWGGASAPHAIFGGAAVGNGFGSFIAAVVAGATLLASLSSAGWLKDAGAERGEFHALALFAAAGMDVLAVANDLLVLFIALEAMSLPLYALAAYRRRRRNVEAALKYFVLGSFSSAIFLMGAALCFGASGSTRLADIAAVAGPAVGVAPSAAALLVLAGAALVLVGLAFKVAAVPFHMWAPDVYAGSPAPVAGFMAGAVKAAGFAALVRVLIVAFGAPFGAVKAELWAPILGGLAFLTMLGGNLLAIPQRSVKRMLAYSSISHAGYVLVAVAAAGSSLSARGAALSAVLVYLAAYAVSVAGAFAVVAVVERGAEGDGVDDLSRFAGLARRSPFLGAAMAVFMLSLGGIPPTAGFVAKLYVFRSAVDAGLVPLAVAGILTSVAGAYYYLRVIVYVFMQPPETDAAPLAGTPAAVGLALALALAGVAVMGLAPDLVAAYAVASPLVAP